MTHDSIADLLTRLRNGYLARLHEVTVPFSKMRGEILRILKKNGYIVDYKLAEDSRSFSVQLEDVRKTKYIPSFRRISRPGQRIYIKSADIRKSRNGVGIYILSTPKGVITGYEAHALGVGGELLCEIY
ncbi:30S ribosomal protein S8 [Candidatus Gracilibacteria bacterium GN02-873]|jgi:ribosomal protein S8|nr:30S ribosomal protein S8 [Candidatus Gracilibacteria bacterium]MDO4873926.1 30S ribosomal protein S8 [Candidatus Gracilibacteria bacterium]RAL55415.1 30S ribosomal protein S8 [Candidatus Gracilibacteria bacterium GN02-873]